MIKKEKITKQELASAFFSLMDGCRNANEIYCNTGILIGKCEEIFNLYKKLVVIGKEDKFEFSKWKNI